MAVVLVIDDDEDIRGLVRVVLSDSGHEVIEAADGRSGLKLAKTGRPDLVITDVKMPPPDGWAVVRKLRSKKATALTPVIFMTVLAGSKDRLRGFQLGADDYLPKPFSPEELTLRVDRVLASKSEIGREAEQAITGSDFEGRLERIGLSTLLVMLEMERQTGVLELRCESEICKIWIRKGSVAHAEVSGADLRGPLAVYHVLEWSAGGFSFREEVVDVEDSVGFSTMHLLVEGARRIDELAVEDLG